MELLNALDLKSGCRVCLRVSSNLTPIFQESDSDPNVAPSMSARISACVGFEVVEMADMPTQICPNCIKEVDRWSEFRSQAQSTNDLLTKVRGMQLEGYNLVSVALADSMDAVAGLSENESTALIVVSDPDILEDLTAVESDDQKNNNADDSKTDCLSSTIESTGLISDNLEELDDGNDADDHDYQDFELETNDSDGMSSRDDSDEWEESQNDEGVSWRLKPVKCPVCSKSFGKHSGVKLHLRVVHTVLKLYPCVICGHVSVVSSDRENHIAKKHKQNLTDRNTCKICGRCVQDAKSHKRHMKNHEEARRCKSCGLLLDTPEALEEHKRTVHVEELRSEPPPDMDTIYQCHHCENISFWKKEDWKDHYLNVHHTEDIYPCKICSKAYRLKRLLEIHERIHTGEKPFMCEQCATRFTSKKSLRTHIRKHTTKFQCKECQKTYTSYSGLYHHTRRHTNETPYVCHECGKQFKSPNGLQFHMRIHTGEKPFRCEHCDFVCRHASGLNAHKVIHSDERPFKCDQCDKTFKMKGWLKEHKKTHSGIKKFVCEVCNHAFIAMYQLRSHMKTHSGERPHICKFCFKQFARRDTLTDHLRTHTKEIKYSCEHCNLNFMSPKPFKKHECAGRSMLCPPVSDLQLDGDLSSHDFEGEDDQHL